jgi:hypothetical protein
MGRDGRQGLKKESDAVGVFTNASLENCGRHLRGCSRHHVKVITLLLLLILPFGRFQKIRGSDAHDI